jgi:nucleotide-binding universal stress UspA family protein
MPPSANAAEEFSQPIKRWIRDHVPEESDMHDRIRFERGFGPAADSIVDFAAKAGVDLIVMSISDLDPQMAAHHPNTGTAHELVSHAPCPVLTIR